MHPEMRRGDPAYQAALAGNFAAGFSLFGVRSTVVPLLVVQQLDLAPGWIGAAFAVGALVQAALLLPAGKAIDSIGRRPTLVAGGLITAASLAGLAFATGPVSLLLAMTVLALGASLLGVAPAAIVGDVVEGRSGTAVAVWQMASDLGAGDRAPCRRDPHRPGLVRDRPRHQRGGRRGLRAARAARAPAEGARTLTSTGALTISSNRLWTPRRMWTTLTVTGGSALPSRAWQEER
jgi:hypothetical protein